MATDLAADAVHRLQLLGRDLASPDGPPLCDAAFAECDGLEMSQEVKTIREGGNNGRQIRAAPARRLRHADAQARHDRRSFDLWEWFEQSIADPSRDRADAEVVMFAADGATERARFVLARCLPAEAQGAAR